MASFVKKSALNYLVGVNLTPRSGAVNLRSKPGAGAGSLVKGAVPFGSPAGIYTGVAYDETPARKGTEARWLELKTAKGLCYVRYDLLVTAEQLAKRLADDAGARLMNAIVESDKATYTRLLVMREDLATLKAKNSPKYAAAKAAYEPIVKSYNARQAKIASDKELQVKKSYSDPATDWLAAKWATLKKAVSAGPGIGEPVSTGTILIAAAVIVVASAALTAYLIYHYTGDLKKATEDSITSKSTADIFTQYVKEATTPEERSRREELVHKAKDELVNDIQNAQDDGLEAGKADGIFGNIVPVLIGAAVVVAVVKLT
ncbi:MAG: hypothetical protein V4543_08425 [Bacteroidota bacterium]